MIRWPVRAARAIARLFEAVQDVDVFVEDQGDESFYLALINAAEIESATVKRVIGLGGRLAVVEAARAYTDARRAVFIVDGDFPWIRGEGAEFGSPLYRLNCYCVENLLVVPSAANEICSEEGMCAVEEASGRLDFASWRKDCEVLVPLAARLAVLNQVDPGSKTIGGSFGAIVTAGAHRLPQLDAAKVAAHQASVEEEIVTAVGDDEFRRRLQDVMARIDALEDKMHAVPGKAMLLPLLFFHVKSRTATPATKDLFRYRLATKCLPENVTEIRNAVAAAVAA